MWPLERTRTILKDCIVVDCMQRGGRASDWGMRLL